MINMETKQQIRKRHLKERNALTMERTNQNSRFICQNLKRFFEQDKSILRHGVFGYYPLGKEASLILLYEWLLNEGVLLAFPKTSNGTMDFYQVSSMDDFTEGAYHIMEPSDHCRAVESDEACCLVPGSVFDRSGGRFGYGKGYYDRYFSLHNRMRRIGVAYESQVEDEIPTESYDVGMQMLATEQTIYMFSSEGG